MSSHHWLCKLPFFSMCGMIALIATKKNVAQILQSSCFSGAVYPCSQKLPQDVVLIQSHYLAYVSIFSSYNEGFDTWNVIEMISNLFVHYPLFFDTFPSQS